MNWYKTAQVQKKILYIMRGLSGSGKSTLAEELGEGGVVYSADDFFMVEGEYVFDAEGLGYAHFWNQGRVEEAMKQQLSPIVADNTNVKEWEMKPYVELAVKYGYAVEIREPQTPWKFDPEELAKRNSHGVPLETIEHLVQEWDHGPTVESILESEKPTR